MKPIPLHFTWDYNDVDRAFWAEHLEGWLPRRIIDAHIHVSSARYRTEPVTEQMRRQYWVNEVSAPMDGPTADHCIRTVFPERKVTCVAFGHASLAFDIEAANEYTRTECLKRGWHSLAVLRPEWSAERVARELAKPGVLGLKPYYSLISRDPGTRDRHLDADIFDFLPHHVLEVANERGAWVTLHVPKADRLGHPANIRQIRQLRERYPDVVLVIAHLGRSYTEPHAREGIPPLADDPGLYWDVSATFNPASFRVAMRHIGPERLLWGTDNPVFFMRGRREWRGRTYFNRTSGDFHFNRNEHEPPDVEAKYTLYTYEALKTLKDVCAELGVGREGVQAIFHDNAEGLMQSVLDAKRARGEQ